MEVKFNTGSPDIAIKVTFGKLHFMETFRDLEGKTRKGNRNQKNGSTGKFCDW